MRIILAFLVGFLSFFYIAHLFSELIQKSKLLAKILPISHNYPGIALVLIGLVIGLLANSDPIRFLSSFFITGAGVGLITHHLLFKRYILLKKAERDFIQKHEEAVERVLEILPGALLWLALTSPIWLSFFLPFAVAYLVILANVYWLISAIKISALIYFGYKKMEYAKKQDWFKKLQADFPNEWNKYYHLIILPTFREGLEVLDPAFESVANSSYPKEKIFLAVGFEAWADQAQVQQVIDHLGKYQNILGGVFTTIHPLLEGEVKGPGTNRNYIVRNAFSELSKKGIKEQDVYVTTLDADFVLHPQFLAGSLHKYLSTHQQIRDKRSYTGTFLYYNNYWQTPTPMRLIAVGTQFWQLSEMVGSDKYMNFSSLSINLKSLLEIGLWIPNKVNDDSGFYWKAYYHFNGNYKVIPHFLPISADAVLDVSLLKTFQNQYLQLKRWAYGVEHIPFVIKQYFQKTDLDFWDKTDKLLFALWGYLRWGALALFITFAGLIVPIINPHYSQSVVAYNLPVISSWILTTAFLSLFLTIYVHEKTAPKRPSRWSIWQKSWTYIQWVLIPLILVSISTLPAIDAQTSLMLGRYLEFRVTRKARLT